MSPAVVRKLNYGNNLKSLVPIYNMKAPNLDVRIRYFPKTINVRRRSLPHNVNICT